MSIFKNSLIYFLGIIIEKGISFLLIPLFTHYLNPKEYGVFSVLNAIIGILIIFFSLSLNGAASRFHIEGNKYMRKWHYGNIFATVTVISFFSAAIFLFFGMKILHFFKIEEKIFLYLIVILVYLNAIYSIYQLKLQMEQRAAEYVINNIAKSFFIAFGVIFVLVFLNGSIVEVFSLQLFVFFIFFIYFFYKSYREKIKFNLNKKLFKRNITYSIYLVPHNIGSIINLFLDRFFISTMISLKETGIYSLATQITSILGVIAVAINSALKPKILQSLKEQNYSFLINLANIVIFIILIIAVFLSLFSLEITSLVASKSYSNAYTVFPYLSFYFVFNIYYFMTSSVLFYVEKATKFVAFATLISLGLNFIYNYFFIKLWGIKGAALATLLSMAIVNYVVIYIANRLLKIDFMHKRLHFFIVLGFLLSYWCIHFNLTFATKFVIFCLFFFLLIFVERKNPLLKSYIR